MLVFNFHHVEPAGLIQSQHQCDRKMITITPEGLRNFIRTFRALGFEFVSMDELLTQYTNPAIAHSNKKSVLITFDDGFKNNLTYGLPVLESEQCPATIFVLPGRLSGNNEWDQKTIAEQERDQLMSLEEIKTLANSPYISIGSHGMTHQHLPDLDDETLSFEINESYQQLSNMLGSRFSPVLAYPWGEYDDRVIEVMKSSPYKLGFTTDKAPWNIESDNPYCIPRYSSYFRDGNPLILTGKLLRHQLLF